MYLTQSKKNQGKDEKENQKYGVVFEETYHMNKVLSVLVRRLCSIRTLFKQKATHVKLGKTAAPVALYFSIYRLPYLWLPKGSGD